MEIAKNNLRIEGERIYLRSLAVEDATEEYVSWLRDEEVNQFLEVHVSNHTLESVRETIK